MFRYKYEIIRYKPKRKLSLSSIRLVGQGTGATRVLKISCAKNPASIFAPDPLRMWDVRPLFGEAMQSKFRRIQVIHSVGYALLVSAVAGLSAVTALSLASSAMAQTAPAAKPFVGTITASAPGLLTVKTDAGVERKVTVPDGVRLQRVAPGAKDLNNAATIQFSDLAVGDRVLVKTAPEPATDPVTAISIVAIPRADVAQKQQQEREDWQKNGVGGLVKSVNAGTGEVIIVSGAGAMAKTITLHVTPATRLKRYAPGSVDFEKATDAPIETIQAGDQLRARGTKDADGTDVAAVEVVSGSFRNISGVIASISTAAQTISLKDLLTKQSVTVHIGPDVQMHKLPDEMAKRLAAMTKSADKAMGGAAATGGAQGSAGQGSRPAYSGPANPAPANPAPANPAPAGQPGGPGFGQGSGPGTGPGTGQALRPGGGDLQQMLSRAPAIHLSDLQKGDAVLLVSTQGTSEVTAVTLLSGVEPLLQAPASTQNMLLSNWSMGSGGAEAAQ